ncbi:recombinase family protein [Micromonospora foliorum]|uniref:recombinase family protein n=1 Tax=Micromonospora foliorum TaxID=2911210 RepID=UPI001EE7E471|nr:recombinase family protein [Micromonospora foliorum]MCG5439655.1 recombinase family protein [Micromonospora foliorum]
MASIARALNDNGVPCPSGADPARNPHRSGRQWMLTTVAAILANPRYTGRQVWNRQRTDRDALPDEEPFDRHHEIQRWSASTDWVIFPRDRAYSAGQRRTLRRRPGNPYRADPSRWHPPLLLVGRSDLLRRVRPDH